MACHSITKCILKPTSSTLKRPRRIEVLGSKSEDKLQRGSVTGNEGRISVDTEWRRVETGQGQTESQELASVCTYLYKVTSATHSGRDRKRENGDG